MGFSKIGVAIIPGSTIETEIPQGRSSMRNESVSASVTNFEAQKDPEKAYPSDLPSTLG